MARSNIKLFKAVDDAPTTTLHLPTVIARTDCPDHNAPFGSHCHEYQAAESDTWHYGVCNKRAKRAGYDGKIHPTSLDRSLYLRTRA